MRIQTMLQDSVCAQLNKSVIKSVGVLKTHTG